MNVKVKLFGPQAQLTGKSEVDVEVAGEPATVAAVRSALGAAEPKLTPSLPESRLAVNHEFASDDQPVRPGDELALIGMVSGG